MPTPPIQPFNPTFGYHSSLKTEFIRGNIPLKKDITGAKIDKKNVSLDHTVPKAKGGKSNMSNYSLMNQEKNWERGTLPLKPFIDLKSLVEYINVMLNVETRDVNGIEYLKKWLPNLLKEI